MTEGRVGSQEFFVEGGIFLLCVGELLRVESQQSPGTIQELVENSTQVGIRGINRERDRSIRVMMDQLRNGREKSLGSGEGRVQHRRPGKGQAAPRRNFL